MSDQSSKHGPRLDEELEHEVSALVHGAPDEGRTEGRLQQAPGDDDDVAHARPDGAVGQHDELDDRALDERSRLAASLASVVYPATRDRLVEAAIQEHAPPATIDRLRQLPAADPFAAFEHVWEALGGGAERR